jgi:hypothetical protein
MRWSMAAVASSFKARRSRTRRHSRPRPRHGSNSQYGNVLGNALCESVLWTHVAERYAQRRAVCFAERESDPQGMRKVDQHLKTVIY